MSDNGKFSKSEEQAEHKTSCTKALSEYGKQLAEKQKVKEMYGMRERQFKRFFDIAITSREGAPGENLLSLLERRLDNVVVSFKISNIHVHKHVKLLFMDMFWLMEKKFILLHFLFQLMM